MFCRMCGSEITEGHEFCGKCGAFVGPNATMDQPTVQSRKDITLHCPRCGKTRLQVQSGNRIVSSTTMARSVGKKHAIGSTSYNSIAETYWFCNSCGMKFRDLDELKAIIIKRQKLVKFCKIYILVAAIVLFLFGIFSHMAGDSKFIVLKMMIGVYPFLVLLPFGLLWIWATIDAKKNEAEYNDLLPKVRA